MKEPNKKPDKKLSGRSGKGKIAGQKTRRDTVTTLLFRTSNENCAELFNHTMNLGHPIYPDDLSDEDIKETAYLRITENGGTPLVQYRDVVKKLKSGSSFAILGIENQSEIDYAMPFRILELDFVNYARQMQTIRDSHTADWKDEQGHIHRPKNVSTGEYLGHFLKSDRLIPCETLVVYWGREPWNGPEKLSDLFVGDADFRHTLRLDMNLLDVCRMSDAEICSYSGELRTVFGFRKYAEDKEKLKLFIDDNESYFRNVSGNVIEVLNELTHSPELQGIRKSVYQTAEGGFDMCKGIQGLVEDGRKEGEKEGRKEGRKEARKEAARKMQEKGFSEDMIAELLETSIDLVRKWLENKPIAESKSVK